VGYSYIIDHIPVSANRRPRKKITPEYLTIHSTGNVNSTARNERAWLVSPSNTRTASWHICVDEKEAIEAIPLDEMAYHAGTAAGNAKSISIEICESGNRQKTVENAAELTAVILKAKGWGIERLRRHYDWSGKVCPRIFAESGWAGWNDFVAQVKAELISQEVLSMFKDVPANHWAVGSIERLAKLGIIKGDDQGNFRPDVPITRAEVVALLDRVLNLLGR